MGNKIGSGEPTKNQLTINELENNIVTFVSHPNDTTLLQSLLQKKGRNITVLKRKLHLHDIEHVHTTKLVKL